MNLAFAPLKFLEITCWWSMLSFNLYPLVGIHLVFNIRIGSSSLSLIIVFFCVFYFFYSFCTAIFQYQLIFSHFLLSSVNVVFYFLNIFSPIVFFILVLCSILSLPYICHFSFDLFRLRCLVTFCRSLFCYLWFSLLVFVGKITMYCYSISKYLSVLAC